jgi:hypothetical protein
MTETERRAFATVVRVLRAEGSAAGAEGSHALAQELRRGSGQVANWERLLTDRQVAKATRRK